VYCWRACHWTGDFTSDDGTDFRRNVQMDGSRSWKHGDRIRAQDTGDRVNVFPPNGGSDLLGLLAAMLFGVVFLALWVWALIRPYRQRINATSAPNLVRPLETAPVDSDETT
jgi:hypothetical protein